MTTLLLAVLLAAQKAPSSTKEAMRPIQLLVGEWRVDVDAPDASPWEESQFWEYKIEKDVYALQLTVKNGKKFKEGLLTYDLKKKVYRFDLLRADDSKAAYEGKLTGTELVLDEQVPESAAAERLNYNLLRDNRFIGSIESRAAGQKVYSETHKYQFTKAGVSIVKVQGPKCVVTGGSPAMSLEHAGKTYWVCCSSCRKEFLAAPAKMIELAKKEGWIK